MQPRNNILDITNPDVAAQTDLYSSRSVGALNDALVVDTNGKSTLAIQLVGAFVGTVVLQGSVDGTTYVTLSGTPLLNVGTGAYSANITAAGLFQSDIAGFTSVKLLTTAYTSGTPTLAARASNADAMMALDAALPAGSALIGGINVVPATTSTLSRARIMAAATTNATSVKATAGTIKTIFLHNNTASAKFLKVYAKATAPTVGTDVPIATLTIPANGPLNLPLNEPGFPVATGIAIAITGAVADSDTTVLAANDVTGFILYN